MWASHLLLINNAFSKTLAPDSLSTEITGDTATTDSNSITLPISENGPETVVVYTAKDSIRLDNKNRILHLFGDAEVTYGQMLIQADRITILLDSNKVFAYAKRDSLGQIEKKVHFQDGDQFFDAPEMRYNYKTKKGKIIDITTQEGELYLLAEKAKKMPDNSIFVKKGKITTCDHPDPHFYFQASKLKVVPQKVMVAGPTHLVIRDLHTPIWVPFGIFPNNSEKQSGVIIPSQGAVQGQTGIQDFGYHWAASELIHFEALGSIYFGGTYRTTVKTDYKVNYKFDGNITFLHNNTVTGVKGLSDYRVTKDYNLIWNHKQDPKAHPKSNLSIGINAKTATFNQTQVLNHSTASSIVQGANTSQIRWDWREKWGTFTVNSNLNQNFTLEQTTIKAPSMTLNVRNQKLYKQLQISGNVAFENTVTEYDSAFNSQIWDKMRNGLRATTIIDFGRSYPLFKYLQVSLPNLTVNGYMNSKYITRQASTDSVQESVVRNLRGAYDIRLGNFGLTTKIYGLYKFKKGMYIEGFRHTVTPSANLTYTPDFYLDHQNIVRTYIDPSTGKEVEYSIFENRNYSVHAPAAAQALLLNYNLRNNLQSKVRDRNDSTETYKKVNVINNFDIGGNYNFLAEEFKWSDLTVNFNTNPGFLKNVNASATISPYYFDDSLNTVVDSLMWKDNKIGRLTNFSVGTNIAIKKSQFVKEKPTRAGGNPRTFDWTLNVSYTFRYTNPGITDPSTNNSVGINGNVNLTENWSFSYNFPFNVKALELSKVSSINLTRKLHCWEFVVNWLPFSELANYTFTIRPRAGILSDLKYEKVSN